ncbi:MAG: sulfotransferase [Planctomycetaceae bacterium]|nr:sulfotransferase [Planctomycetaceae bacterium]
MSWVSERLSCALDAHRAGRLGQAEAVYQEILAKYSAQPDALHLSGVIAHQLGNHEQACELIRRAIVVNPAVPSFHCNLAEALRAAGDLDAAEASCRQALSLQPQYPEVLHNWGVICFKQHRYAEAEAKYQESVAQRPDFVPTLVALADALREQGQLRRAAETYRRAIEIDPQSAIAHANLGLLLALSGDPEQGLQHCRQAVELNPKSVDCLHNLGSLLLESGEIDESLDMLERALGLDPNSPRVCVTLGRVSHELAEYGRAVSWFERALRLDPQLTFAKCQLGIVLLDMGNPEQAAVIFQNVLEAEPRFVEALSGLARARLDQGDVDGAVASHRAAIEQFPEAAFLHAALGTTLSTAGDLDGAVASHRAAIAINERCVPAHSGLVSTLRGKATDDDLKRIETLLEASWVNGTRRANLLFGLAQGYDGRGDYARAAECLATANSIQKEYYTERELGYDPDEHRSYIDRVIETFTPEYFERVWEFGHSSRRPVFIVGMPRSGTTLTEQILASHPQVHGAGERRFATLGFNLLPHFHGVQLPPLDCLAQLTAEQVQKIAEWHLDRLTELDQGRKVYVVDKMPDNYHMLGWIVTLFPHARIIHCRRDVRDVAFSCWITNFSKIRWANDLEHLADRVNQYRRVTEHFHRVLPVPILEVDYERMVADQLGSTRRMLEFLNLDWDPDCLNFHKTERLVRTASVAQVRQPIYSRSVARWKRYESYLQPFLDRLEDL